MPFLLKQGPALLLLLANIILPGVRWVGLGSYLGVLITVAFGCVLVLLALAPEYWRANHFIALGLSYLICLLFTSFYTPRGYKPRYGLAFLLGLIFFGGITLLINTLSLFLISGNSMYPALQSGDIVLTYPVTADQVQEGDIVLFNHSRLRGRTGIKRVERIDDSRGLRFYLVGDNRLNSYDSRMFGSVLPDQVSRRANVVLFNKNDYFNRMLCDIANLGYAKEQPALGCKTLN